ncbi:hypothetical protein AACH06_25780 [Ideonella sp. DXS29W]|uniref:Uncharacterized protein n=1 Tax=Ideonella lacteola TaxID=2984193 RepID=A0ABU9BWJ9_9BURK
MDNPNTPRQPSAFQTIRRMVRESPLLYALLAVTMLTILNGLLCAWFGRGDPTSKAIEGTAAAGVLRAGWLCKGATDCERAYLWEGYVSRNLPADMAQQASDLARLDPESSSARWLCLNSPGGHLGAASLMAYALRDGHLNTCVVPILDDGPSGDSKPARAARCDSACPTVWMGGERHIMSGAQTRLGLHESFIVDSFWCRVGNCGALVVQQVMLLGNAVVLGEWIPRVRMLWAGLGKGPKEVHAVNGEEAEAWGLQTKEDIQEGWIWRPRSP